MASYDQLTDTGQMDIAAISKAVLQNKKPNNSKPKCVGAGHPTSIFGDYVAKFLFCHLRKSRFTSEALTVSRIRKIAGVNFPKVDIGDS
tara:strand:- start:719 stop:985 length:267 start_codon:yes stop_codon:yes gene_type:complete